jgi:sensor histidine kinase YesM
MTVLVCSALITLGYYLNAWTSHKTFTELFGKRPDQFLSIFSIMAFPSTVGAMTLAMSVKLGKNWLNAEKKRLVLEKENLETELKYLKSQINPHFLFNTINSIFVLIHKNPDLASESLASFSEMLRYQLYECNERIFLSRSIIPRCTIVILPRLCCFPLWRMHLSIFRKAGRGNTLSK